MAALADTAAAVGDDPVPQPPPPPQLSRVACSDPRAKGWAAVGWLGLSSSDSKIDEFSL